MRIKYIESKEIHIYLKSGEINLNENNKWVLEILWAFTNPDNKHLIDKFQLEDTVKKLVRELFKNYGEIIDCYYNPVKNYFGCCHLIIKEGITEINIPKDKLVLTIDIKNYNSWDIIDEG